MQLTCVAIDDEPLALALLRSYIARYPSLQLLHSFEDALSGAEYLRHYPVDLLFVDINMPDVTGISLVRSLLQPPMVIFTTAYKQFAHEGFELDAVDYLVKPIAPERFEKAVNKAVEYYRFKNAAANAAGDSLFVRSGYELIKIPFADIVYIETLEDYLKIHRLQNKPVMTLMTVKAMLEKLPQALFRRIHRSYIVALHQVKSVANKKVRIGQIELPVSDRYADLIKEWKAR